MTDEQRFSTLEEFLIRNSAWGFFRKNVSYDMRSRETRRIDAKITQLVGNAYTAGDVIRGAFGWASSPEGISYWDELNKKFITLFQT